MLRCNRAYGSAAGDTHDIVGHPICLRTGNAAGVHCATIRACRVSADRRHDRRRHSRHDRQSGPGLRRASASSATISMTGWRCGTSRSSDKPSDIKPGLATSWEVDPNNHKRWIYHLRQGVKWHDGCPFTADDVLWNFGAHHRREGAAVLHAADGVDRAPTPPTSLRSRRSTTARWRSTPRWWNRCSRTR